MLNFMEIFFALGVVLCQIFPFFTVTNEVAVQLLYQVHPTCAHLSELTSHIYNSRLETNPNRLPLALNISYR